MPLKVKIDTSFIVPILKYLSKPSDELLWEISKHDAGKRTYNHAIRFKNTKEQIRPFWKGVLKNLGKKEDLIDRVKAGLTYLYNEQDSFNEAISALEPYSPEGTDLGCRLYAMLGYDQGIVSEGHALINIGHEAFERDQRELLYMSMHELHHVIYTAFNPMFDMAHVHQIEHLCSVIRYCAHLEGTAVYSTFEARQEEKAYSHKDYQILLNERARKKRVSEFFDILTKLETRPVHTISDRDWKILDRMSGGKRLWYVAGAHMAEIIDKNLGRETLNETIRHGPEDFFKKYHEAF